MRWRRTEVLSRNDHIYAINSQMQVLTNESLVSLSQGDALMFQNILEYFDAKILMDVRSILKSDKYITILSTIQFRK